MFKDLFKSLSSFLSSIFGTTESKPTPQPQPVPPRDDTDERTVPQDGAEVEPGDVITIIDEAKNEVIEGPEPEITDSPVPDTPVPVLPENPTPTPPVPTDPAPAPDPELPGDPAVIVVPDVPSPTKPDPEPGPDPLPAPDPTNPPTPSAHPQRYCWILDNGHGKLTAGKRSPIFDDGQTQFFEYEFNRDVVVRIMALLDAEGVRYHDLVPDYLTVGNILQERVARANSLQSDLPKRYLSVHSNAAPAPAGRWAAASIRGIETWHYHTSATGKAMAQVFQRHLIETLGWRNRHLKSRPTGQFYVLRKTTMAAVLTENGFYNNKAEALELMKPEIRQQIAQAHVDAILELEGRVLA